MGFFCTKFLIYSVMNTTLTWTSFVFQVEHIIREDYLVEAMELLELYCDLLLARFGLIETMK